MRILVFAHTGKHGRVAIEHAIELAQGGGYEKGYHTVILASIFSTEKNENPIRKLSSAALGAAKKLTMQKDSSAGNDKLDAQRESEAVLEELRELVNGLKEVKVEEVTAVGNPAVELLRIAKEKKVQRIVMARWQVEPSKYAKVLLLSAAVNVKFILSHIHRLALRSLFKKRGMSKTVKNTVKSLPEGVHLHVVQFGSEVVEKFPKGLMSAQRLREMRDQGVKFGFNEDDAQALVDVFCKYDGDGSLGLDACELNDLLEELGEDPEADDVVAEIRKVDTDRSGTLEFDEYLQLMVALRQLRFDAMSSNGSGSGTLSLSSRRRKSSVLAKVTDALTVPMLNKTKDDGPLSPKGKHKK